MERLLLNARHLISLAVASALVSSGAILVFGAIVTVRNVGSMFLAAEFTTEASKKVALEAIEVLDLLFLGVVLYITAIGLYHLFISSSLRLPRWFAIEEFEDLKVTLISVVMVLLVINFASSVLELTSAADVFNLGAGISLVIASIALILYVRSNSSNKSKRDYLNPPNPPRLGGDARSDADGEG
ncbi:YqhA family protein [Nodosilinea sp. P-1105]|uniref:YqhA family protein n=1 Tax=Nodosilinea sp. P-1105 TaxID=2546229 RepID=UPI00146E80DE|nr:YqhA family protein [Nodosilinea sp. P-1105]NMF82851.1 YqhA family protein [Nodosilinea sp. P-1105]